MALLLRTGRNTFTTLGTGKHMAFYGARFKAHRAGIVAGIVTLLAQTGLTVVKTDNHGPPVGHPCQTLKKADGTTVAAEKVTRKTKLDTQQDGGNTDKNKLVAGQFSVKQVAIYFLRG